MAIFSVLPLADLWCLFLFQMKSVAHLPWKAFTYKVSPRFVPGVTGGPFVGSPTHIDTVLLALSTKTSFQILKCYKLSRMKVLIAW